MEHSEVIAERDAAGVLARVIVCALAIWCLHAALLAGLYGLDAGASSSFELSQGLGVSPGVTILLPLALAIALFARGYRVVQWAAGRTLRREARGAPGSGWIAVMLPLLSIWFLTRALNSAATSLQSVLAFDRWEDLQADLVSIALALSLLFASPALTAIWARCNATRRVPVQAE